MTTDVQWCKHQWVLVVDDEKTATCSQCGAHMEVAHDRGIGGEILEAKHGHFSDRFHRNLTASLRIAPGVVQHVASLVAASGGSEDKVDGTRDAPLPMSVQAFADVNEIYSLLVYWTRVFAEHLDVRAPKAAVRAWRNTRGTIVGLPTEITPGDARKLVDSMTSWLTLRIEPILHLDPHEVMEFYAGSSDKGADDLKMDAGLKTVFAVDARWAQQAKPRYSDMPCPDDRCKGKIAVFPPQEYGEDERIVCEGCGRHFLPEQYEHLITVFKQIRAEQKSAAKTTNHLIRKYAS